MSSDKIKELSELVDSAINAINGLNETNVDDVKNELIRINSQIQSNFGPQNFNKTELDDLDKLVDRLGVVLRSDINSEYNKSAGIHPQNETDEKSFYTTYNMVSGLHHDVKYKKTSTRPSSIPPPPPSQTNNNSIVERIGTLEQKVEELQKRINKAYGGKTHRKRSRKSKKSRRRR